jgi:Fibronectin type III domain
MRIASGRAVAAATAVAAAAAGVAFGAGPLLEGASGHARVATVKAKDARLRFEINATDGDGGVHVLFDADDWGRLSIVDPTGRRIFTTTTEGRMRRQGGTELFVESAEPPFSELPLPRLLQRWPEGSYRFTATGADGTTIVGSARLSHDLPDAPTLVSPLPGDGPQDPNRTVVRWQSVAPADGSPIIGYQVLVVRTRTGLKALPKVTLDVTMPPTATSLTVPPGFLLPGTEYEWEVLAIERGGNQTLASSTFTTLG